MVELLNLRDLAWALTTLLEVVLLLFLLRRRLYRSHPAFFSYILATILQSAVVALVYRYLGSQSLTTWNIAWAAQAVVICTRWFAVTEIARKALAEYTGIWRMTNRILFLLGMVVLVYSIASSNKRWTLAVLNADRSVELCIASLIVCMFLFVRYYRLPMANLERLLSVGFCLYSCSYVINDSIYEKWRSSLGGLWNYLDSLTFLASLLLWISAVHNAGEPRTVTVPAPLSPEQYGELSQKLNSRLHLLNNRLNHLLHSEDSRS
jgi:hypothetical protein